MPANSAGKPDPKLDPSPSGDLAAGPGEKYTHYLQTPPRQGRFFCSLIPTETPSTASPAGQIVETGRELSHSGPASTVQIQHEAVAHRQRARVRTWPASACCVATRVSGAGRSRGRLTECVLTTPVGPCRSSYTSNKSARFLTAVSRIWRLVRAEAWRLGVPWKKFDWPVPDC